MNTNKRIWIHVGWPKTGTTAIQRYLAANSESLKRMGVLYPESGRYGITDAHHELASALTGGPTAAVSGKKQKKLVLIL